MGALGGIGFLSQRKGDDMKLRKIGIAIVLALGLTSLATAPASACEVQSPDIWFACC